MGKVVLGMSVSMLAVAIATPVLAQGQSTAIAPLQVTAPQTAADQAPTASSPQAMPSDAASLAVEGTTGGNDGDIVVTALKRSESIQTIPAAINVVTNEQIANSGATKLEDITRVSPSLSFTPAGGQIHSTISMRGIFSNNLSPGVPSAVGVVVDDIAQPPEAQGFNELADIERIEVLRGPQSTVSGRNASAGLINIVTRAPTKQFTAKFDASATTDQEYRIQGYVSGPISDTLAGSLTGYYNNYRGNLYNVARDDHLGRESVGVRGKLRWQPITDLEVTLTGFYQHLDERQVNPTYEYFAPGAVRLGRTPAVAVGPLDYNYRNDRTYSPVDGFQKADSKAGSLRIAYNLGDYQLLSITGYQKEDIDQFQDVLGTTALGYPSAAFTGAQAVTVGTETKSQEIRLISPGSDRFNYVLGAYYLDTSVDYDFTRLVVAPFNRLRHTDLKNYAGYIRANFDVTDRLKLIGGLRYNREEVSYRLFDRISNSASANATSDNVVVGEANAQYQFTSTKMVYARYARGYQGKAFDLDAAYTPGTVYRPLDPEKVDSFEVGAKLQFLDRRITLNLAAYDTTYYNYQAQSGLVTETALNFQLLNAGTVRTRGLEIDSSVKVSPYLRLDFSGAYTDAHIVTFNNAPCYAGQTVATGCVTTTLGSTQNLNGRQLANTPDLKANGGIEYTLPMPSLPVKVSLRGDVRWQSTTNFDILGNPFTKQPDYAILNLSANIASRSDKYKVTVFVNNVTNKQYFTQLTDNRGFFGTTALVTRYLPRDFNRYGGIRLSVAY